MIQRVGTALLLGASLVLLAACGDPDAPGSSGSATVDDFEPIRARLRPEALRTVAWDGAESALAPDGTWKTYAPGTSWNWQLQGEIDTSYPGDVYVMDLFAQVDGALQQRLHANGRDAFCYFSVGTYEPYRPDRAFFDDDLKGRAHRSYPDETWLDTTRDEVVRIMVNRLDIAKDIGCDGVELDNVDGYAGGGNDTGFDIPKADQIRYVRILANEAHRRGLAVALKNGSEILPELVDWFDLSINEECHEFDECGPYAPMVAAGKPVLNAEYQLKDGNGERLVMRDARGREINADIGTATGAPDFGDPAVSAGLERLCAAAEAAGTQTLLLPLRLDGTWRYSCAGR